MIIKVPVEHKRVFEESPEKALRDLACIPTASVSSFFRRMDLVRRCISFDRENPFDEKSFGLDHDFVASLKESKFARYAHCDLGWKKDAVGIAICHASKFVSVEVGEHEEIDLFPVVKFDLLARIQAVKGGEIDFAQVRKVFYRLASAGMDIRLITFDRFSVETPQALAKSGFTVAFMSIDRTAKLVKVDVTNKIGVRAESTQGEYTVAMSSLRHGLYSGRVDLPIYLYDNADDLTWFERECMQAEENVKKRKVDHSPSGSNDLLQSVAGAYFNLVNNEEADDNLVVEEDRLAVGEIAEDEFYRRVRGTSEKRLAEYSEKGDGYVEDDYEL